MSIIKSPKFSYKNLKDFNSHFMSDLLVYGITNKDRLEFEVIEEGKPDRITLTLYSVVRDCTVSEQLSDSMDIRRN